jgi:phage/plasmid-like protein (TIGR03299 family)
MAHEFETGFVVRKQAWHGLAAVLPENPSVTDALRHAGLDWDVLEQPLHTNLLSAEGVAEVEVTGWKALMRGSDKSVLGVVTDTYKPFQNREAFGWFQELVDDGTCKIETAGSLQQGRKVWVQARYADAIEVKDGDAIVPYLLLANGHDGKMSLRIMNTPIRVVCWNTMQAAGATEDGDAEAESSGGIAISHQGDVASKALAARRAIVAMNRDLKVTVDAYRRMAKLPVTEAYVRELAKQLWDRDYIQARDLVAKFRQRQEHEAPSVREETARKIAELEEILNTPSRTENKVVEAFHGSPGCEGKTAWDAFNAVTYQIDHGMQGSQESRLTSSWFGNGARKRAKAFQLIAGSA